METSLELHHGDCLEILKTIPDKSVDLILCDLPYGCMTVGEKGIVGKKSKCYNGQMWDIKINLDDFWEQIKRICKNTMTPVLMFCSLRFYGDLFNSNPKWFQYGLIWKKQRGTNYMDANIKPLNDFEIIAVFSKQRPYFDRKEGMCMKSVLEFPIPSKKIHPTEKPSELYRFLIERYCPVGGTVLDPTAGSGNSVFTAYDMNRNAIGIEKDDAFFAKMVKRLE
jgi:site-specific DNA-methyltransferase (adenine-specific)